MGKKGTHDAGGVNGNGAAKLGRVLLDVRPDVFRGILFTSQLAQLSNTARGLALGPRRADDLGGGNIASPVVIFGRVCVHPLEVEEDCCKCRPV